MSLIKRGVNEYADRIAYALDHGVEPDMTVVVALAQECVRLHEALEWIASAMPDENEGVRPLDDLLDRIQGEAKAVIR